MVCMVRVRTLDYAIFKSQSPRRNAFLPEHLTLQIITKMKKLIIAFMGLSLLAAACKGKEEKKEGPATIADVKELGDKVKQASDASASKAEARKAKGDTIAMPYKDLEAYLPEISGYTKEGEPKGSQMNMPGMGSWSTAEQAYTNGDKKIKVTLMDYNAAFQAFSMMTAVFKMGYSMEDGDKKQDATDLGIKDVAAYETIYKKDQRAEMAVVAGDRFLIQINSDGSNDPQLLYSTAKGMKLSDLAAR